MAKVMYPAALIEEAQALIAVRGWTAPARGVRLDFEHLADVIEEVAGLLHRGEGVTLRARKSLAGWMVVLTSTPTLDASARHDLHRALRALFPRVVTAQTLEVR